METMIKIWIDESDLRLVAESKAPKLGYHKTKPIQSQGLVELTIPYSVVESWKSSKILLKD